MNLTDFDICIYFVTVFIISYVLIARLNTKIDVINLNIVHKVSLSIFLLMLFWLPEQIVSDFYKKENSINISEEYVKRSFSFFSHPSQIYKFHEANSTGGDKEALFSMQDTAIYGLDVISQNWGQEVVNIHYLKKNDNNLQKYNHIYALNNTQYNELVTQINYDIMNQRIHNSHRKHRSRRVIDQFQTVASK